MKMSSRLLVTGALTILGFLLLAVPLSSAKGIQKQHTMFAGKKRTVYLYVPASAPTPAPLLLLLHGNGVDGSVMITHWRYLADKVGIVLVAPDALDSEHWRMPRDGPEFLKAAVEMAKGAAAIDDRRIYLFGHSGGAVFGLFMALLESEYFAAASLHAAALRPEDYAALQDMRRKIPIQLIVGQQDQLFPLGVVRATRDAMKQQGIPVDLLEIAHHDHNYYAISRQVNEYAWNALSGHALSEKPRFAHYVP